MHEAIWKNGPLPKADYRQTLLVRRGAMDTVAYNGHGGEWESADGKPAAAPWMIVPSEQADEHTSHNIGFGRHGDNVAVCSNQEHVELEFGEISESGYEPHSVTPLYFLSVDEAENLIRAIQERVKFIRGRKPKND